MAKAAPIAKSLKDMFNLYVVGAYIRSNVCCVNMLHDDPAITMAICETPLCLWP